MQLASPQHCCALLDLGSDDCTWLPLDELVFADYANGGICGVCRVPGALVLATQSTPPLLVLYDPVGRRIKAQRDLSPAADLHSIVYRAGAILVASTGTNEIYEVPLDDTGFGDPRRYWCYPGVEYDRDLVHLNGLTLSPEGVIASCFGPREPDGSWGSAGSVFLVEPHRVIRDGLSQPHSPLCCGDRLFFAESRGHRVHVAHRDSRMLWREDQVIDAGGYVRGLAVQGDRLWMGLSAPRRVSRSRGTPNQGVGSGGGAALACIDLGTLKVIERRALDGLGDEIYDLLILEDLGTVGRPADALTQRIAGMQAAIDTIRRDHIETTKRLGEKMGEKMGENEAIRALAAEVAQAVGAGRAYAEQLRQTLIAEQAYAVKLMQALQAEQIVAAKLGSQLRTVTGSRLWRVAQWLRRLAGREPYVPDLERPPAPDLSRPPVAAPGQPPGPAADPVAPPLAPETTATRPMAEVFGAIYVDNYWGSEDSRSGTGSDLQQTAVIRETLPGLVRELGVQTMLDVPCGDFHWMRTLDLGLDYIGADVVPALIAANTAQYANDRRRFQVIDIANDTLPRVDLVFCRDLLVHFSFADALRAIANLKRSGATYLLTTTFTNRTDNFDIETGQWRAINLQLAPYNFPPPLRMINENCTEFGTDWADKSLGLWRLVDL